MRVQVRELAQRQSGGLDDQVVDRDLRRVVVQARVELAAQVHQRRHVDAAGHVEVRNLLLALDHALADARAHLAQRDFLDVRAGWCFAVRRRDSRSRCGGCGCCGRLHRGGGRFTCRDVLDVLLDDAATGACALHAAQVDPTLVGDASRDGAGLEARRKIPVAFRLNFSRGGLLRGGAGLVLARFPFMHVLGGTRRIFRFCDGGFGGILRLIGLGPAFVRHGFALSADVGDRGANRQHGARFGQELQNRAADLRFDLDGRFVGFDFRNHVTLADRVTDLLRPVDQRALGHVEAELGHNHLLSHYTNSLTAATTFSALGSAISSISRE